MFSIWTRLLIGSLFMILLYQLFSSVKHYFHFQVLEITNFIFSIPIKYYIGFSFLTFSLVITKLEMCPNAQNTYKVEIVPRIFQDHERRRIVFLTSEDDRRVTAKPAFDGLEENIDVLLRQRFDAWIDGQPPKNHRYHGFWGNYPACYVFKIHDHRFYGFLTHPRKSDRRYEVCILVKYATKNEKETDETDLKHVEGVRSTLDVIRIIDNFFKE